MSVARGAPNAGHYYSNIVSPIKVDMQFTVASTDTGGFGLTSLKSNGFVQNVFMHTSATPATGSPNPLSGYALVHMKQNFNTFLGASWIIEPPVTGGAINISGSGLTASTPYQIVTVGAVPAALFTVVAVADSSGSLAGTYFKASDAFGNNYVFYNIVSGSGTPPALTGSLTGYTAIPVTFATNAANTTVGAALATAMGGVNGGNSWTAINSGHTVTVTSAVANQNFIPRPTDVNTGFTVSAVTYTSLSADWQSVGLPQGLTPTIGQVFFATTTGGALGTGTVKALTVSGVDGIEVLGNTNTTIATSSIATFQGAYITLQFLGSTSSSVTTKIPTAPANGSVVSLSLYFDQSSVTVDGL